MNCVARELYFNKTQTFGNIFHHYFSNIFFSLPQNFGYSKILSHNIVPQVTDVQSFVSSFSLVSFAVSNSLTFSSVSNLLISFSVNYSCKILHCSAARSSIWFLFYTSNFSCDYIHVFKYLNMCGNGGEAALGCLSGSIG